MQSKDTIWRSVVKTIFFKLITTSITAMFTGLGKAVAIHLILTTVYLIYERVWNKIKWGCISIDGKETERLTKGLQDIVARVDSFGEMHTTISESSIQNIAKKALNQ
jgi:uncharacterized membrane protein